MKETSETPVDPEIIPGQEMYHDRMVAEHFARLEQNEKNFKVAEIVDKVIAWATAHLPDPLHVAELGGGAHPDRYHRLFERLLQSDPPGQIDWVDVSPVMLELANHYLDDEQYAKRREVIRFVENDMLTYLDKLEDQLDLTIMKYTFDYLPDLDPLFARLANKLKPGGVLVATLADLSPELRSHSTNARYLYQDQEIPLGETRTLQEGESYGIKFFKESGNPDGGYLEGAQTIKYYHSAERITELAKQYGFETYLGDWKAVIDEADRVGEEMDQNVLVLRKKV